MVIESPTRGNGASSKDSGKPKSYSLALVTDNGVVGLQNDHRLHIAYPKHVDQVLDSIPMPEVTRLGTQIHLDGLHPSGVHGRRHLNYDEARGSLTLFTDVALRQLLTTNGIPFQDQSFVVLPDERVMEVLGVERAQPVRHVQAVDVNDWKYTGELKDQDKPLVSNLGGHVTAYADKGEVQWAKFYGPLERSGGRVWVDITGSGRPMHLSNITDEGVLQKAYLDLLGANFIETYPYDKYNIYAPEGSTTVSEAVRRYEAGFINLAAEIATMVGKIRSVDVSPLEWSLYKPDDLTNNGFEIGHSLDGKQVMGTKGDRRIVLIDVGTNYPLWMTTISRPVTDISFPQELANVIKEELLVA